MRKNHKCSRPIRNDWQQWLWRRMSGSCTTKSQKISSFNLQRLGHAVNLRCPTPAAHTSGAQTEWHIPTIASAFFSAISTSRNADANEFASTPLTGYSGRLASASTGAACSSNLVKSGFVCKHARSGSRRIKSRSLNPASIASRRH